jgi:Tol biopolymer transport system component
MPFNVTDNDIDDGAPDYSPAGTKIAYSAFDGNDYEMYTIEATGGTPFQVTDNDTYDQTPSYSPNGKKIAYSGSSITEPTGTGYEIYTINVGGG